jgi:hypothetical protein
MDETTASTVGTGALDIERSAALQCRSTSHVKKQLSTQKTYASLLGADKVQACTMVLSGKATPYGLSVNTYVQERTCIPGDASNSNRGATLQLSLLLLTPMRFLAWTHGASRAVRYRFVRRACHTVTRALGHTKLCLPRQGAQHGVVHEPTPLHAHAGWRTHLCLVARVAMDGSLLLRSMSKLQAEGTTR